MKNTKFSKYNFRIRYIILLILGMFFALIAESVRIGAYDNPPKIYKDSEGNIAGFWYEITNQIAKEEKWDLIWVYGSWDECLSRLETNEIDIMVDTGLTPEREKKYLFSNEVVQLSWTRIYKNQDSNIENILDLEGKKIGGLKNSFDLEGPEGLRKILNDFQIKSEIVQMNSYEDIFNALENKTIDAGIVDKDFGDMNDKKSKIKITSIIFQPAKMLYAFNKNSVSSNVFKEKIDKAIKELKEDKNSIYYTAMDYFFDQHSKEFAFPFWLIVVLIFVLVLFFLFFIMNRFLRFEVKSKTNDLKESEARYRNIIEFAADGIIIGSNEGYLIETNEVACQLFGYRRDEMIGKHMSEMPFTEESLKNAPLRFDLLNQGLTVTSERTIRRRDYSEIIIEMKTKMMKDGTYQSSYRDITERNKNITEINSLNSRFEYVLGATHTGFDMIDEEYNVIYVDPGWVAKLGDFHGKKCYEYFMGKNQICPTCAIPEAFRTGVSTISEEFLEKENRYVEVHTIPLKEKYNEKRLAAEFNVDITDRKNSEIELKKLLETLEEKVQERTSELVLSNKELESFSYSVSHDLRAPIRHILGFTDIFKKDYLPLVPEKGQEILNKIIYSSEKMEKLIDDLLNFSRTSRQELHRSNVDTGSIIKAIISDMSHSSENIQWKIPDMPKVIGDKNLLNIVWSNLIDNAIKYTGRKDKAVIEIGFKESKEDIEFYIKDNGIGFDMEFYEKLFGVFHRLHLEKDFPGTGIGLAMVKRIINRHGGKVWAEGEVDKGATFYFSLPKMRREYEK